jgi:hypothetical protein
MPVKSLSIPTNQKAVPDGIFPLDGALTIIETSPQSRNSHTISDSFQAVVTASAANSAHSNQSFFSVLRMSLYALRAMIAITAAPTP